MTTLKAFHYRLYPTKEQRRLLDRQLEECRWLWNTVLAERKQAWENATRPWTTTSRRRNCRG
jgi:putative transposase